jgi:hypothetical protein
MICARCKKETPIDGMAKRKNNKWYSWCKICTAENTKKYRKRKLGEDAEAFREHMNTLTKKWHKKNPERQKEIQQKSRWKLRMKVLRHYGGKKPKCACCGEDEIMFLALDHIDGGGCKDRKKNGLGMNYYNYLIRNNFPKGIQVLCHNCNQAKGYYGKCPHQKS